MTCGLILKARPLTREAFAPFGDVLDTHGELPSAMNGDKALRYHALAKVRIRGDDARVVLSIAASKPVAGLVEIVMVERHPFGSQSFMPLADGSFLVVVCPNQRGCPEHPQAFVAAAGQGLNYRADACWVGSLGVWCFGLCPISMRSS